MSKVEKKIANNKGFNEAWVKFQREVGEVLSMCYMDIDDIPANKWADAFRKMEASIKDIHYLEAK